ncbi:cysteine proteinase inhibitor 1-like [Actinidia eriantha]|uniref:cysteine proteinase inhibitor 1-like n=1 Tax=Actinidia eriantha TaxID=165200 RepID=UPI0025835894|nr:cysteine proteinase inhibitor 1-like [Actinidia eriantha]
MALKSQQTLLILTLLVPYLFSAALGGRNEAVGGWQPIKDLSAPEVQDVAQFAVTEHNKEASTNLELASVVKGEKQVVSGINYRLTILAEDGGNSGNYVAVVWVRPWLHSRNLTSFEKL